MYNEKSRVASIIGSDSSIYSSEYIHHSTLLRYPTKFSHRLQQTQQSPVITVCVMMVVQSTAVCACTCILFPCSLVSGARILKRDNDYHYKQPSEHYVTEV